MDFHHFHTQEIGTIASLSTNEFEWSVPHFLSMVNIAVNQCKDAHFYSPDIEACEYESWYLKVEIGSDGNIFVYLQSDNHGERTHACFLGFKKSDGTVEERFLSTTLRGTIDGISFYLPLIEVLSRKSSLLPSDTLTITCSIHLLVPKPEFRRYKKSSVTALDNENWEWKIPNFLEQQTSLCSNNFRKGKYWNLQLENAYDSILVYLQTTYLFCYPLLCSIGLRKSDGMVEKRFPSMPQQFTDDSPKLLFRLPIHELHRRKLEFLPSDTLTVVLNMQLVDYTTAQHGPFKECTTKPEEQTGLANLSKNLKQLLLSEEDSDVVLNVMGTEFKAHRCILRARSPVLAATFQHDMVEKQEGVVKIDDCDPESFGNFLHFFYAGRTTEYPNFDHALQLYKTAHKYDVPDLREECLEYLKSNLTVENVCDVMSLALQYDEDRLFVFAKEFCLENSTAVAKTMQFRQFFFSNTNVAQELMVDMTKAKK